MAIQREYFGERADSVKLYRTFSDAAMMIRQNETGVLLDEAVDVEDANFTYTETDVKITHPDDGAPENDERNQ